MSNPDQFNEETGCEAAPMAFLLKSSLYSHSSKCLHVRLGRAMDLWSGSFHPGEGRVYAGLAGRKQCDWKRAPLENRRRPRRQDPIITKGGIVCTP